MDKNDHGLLKKVAWIRSLLDHNKAKHRSADQGSKQTYDYLREKLTTDAGSSHIQRVYLCVFIFVTELYDRQRFLSVCVR